MGNSGISSTVKERVIIVLLLALLPLLPPLLELWSGVGSYWFSPYLVWSAMIIAAYLLQRHLSKGSAD
jgi:hypothetical protein